jgi:hypothetical protein
MFQTLPQFHRQHRTSSWLIVLVSLASFACNDRDETKVPPGGAGGSGGTGLGGSAGASVAGSSGSGGTAGNAGNGGSGGSVGVDLDAGADATIDASSSVRDCVVGTLEAYCGQFECPALADARDELRSSDQPPYLRAIIQRPCVAPNGAARIAVTGEFRSWSRTYIYNAATEQLVGVDYINDFGGCEVLDPGDPDFGDTTGFFGEASPDCSPGGLRLFIPDGCADAGAVANAPLDAGPYECVLTP